MRDVIYQLENEDDEGEDHSKMYCLATQHSTDPSGISTLVVRQLDNLDFPSSLTSYLLPEPCFAHDTFSGASLYNVPWVALRAACACSREEKSTKQKLCRPSAARFESSGLILLLTAFLS
jgi:hypothetical protein